jgi:DNA-binding CsgD family transcriptional regulator
VDCEIGEFEDDRSPYVANEHNVRDGDNHHGTDDTTKSQTTKQRDRPTDRLSERQRVCLQLLANGADNREIAHAMGICPSRVNQLIAAIKRKLAARTREQAVAIAVDLGAVSVHQCPVENF